MVPEHHKQPIPLLVLALALAPFLGCRSAGPYGFATVYASTSDEEAATKEATEYDPVRREFFGFVRGLDEELGCFSLDELISAKNYVPITWASLIIKPRSD